MPAKRYLMTPGPTPVPPQVLAAMAEAVVHHRAPDFRAIYEECLARLREVYRTEREVLVFTASGTAAMESVVANLCGPGDRVLVVSAGYFGERWGQIADLHGCATEWIEYEWGETPSADDVAARLRELGDVKVVCLTQSETSTGVVADIQALAHPVKEAGALVAVDAISSLGAMPLETDAWGLDAVAAGSQKALMTPPGLALCSVSDHAWGRTLAQSRSFYVDWQRTRKAQARFDAAFTPAVSLVSALNVALGLLIEEGLEAAFQRHVRLGRACRAGAKAMGLELFSPDEDRSCVVTALRVPEGVDGDELALALRDRHGITVAPGQGRLKGKIVRIGHIGFYDVFDITTVLAALELTLAELGADVERGVAVTRALETFEAATV